MVVSFQKYIIFIFTFLLIFSLQSIGFTEVTQLSDTELDSITAGSVADSIVDAASGLSENGTLSESSLLSLETTLEQAALDIIHSAFLGATTAEPGSGQTNVAFISGDSLQGININLSNQMVVNK